MLLFIWLVCHLLSRDCEQQEEEEDEKLCIPSISLIYHCSKFATVFSIISDCSPASSTIFMALTQKHTHTPAHYRISCQASQEKDTNKILK